MNHILPLSDRIPSILDTPFTGTGPVIRARPSSNAEAPWARRTGTRGGSHLHDGPGPPAHITVFLGAPPVFQSFHTDDLEIPRPSSDRRTACDARGRASPLTPTPTDRRKANAGRSWDGSMHGPKPRPDWVITALGAVDADLGVLKTGKEADVHLRPPLGPGRPRPGRRHGRQALPRARPRCSTATPATSRAAASGAVAETRAMGRRTGFGKALIAGQWAMTEFDVAREALGRWTCRCPTRSSCRRRRSSWSSSAPTGRPHRGWRRPGPTPRCSRELFEQLRETMARLALHGWAHGDLSPYNVLLHEEPRLVVIDWPQIVDIIGNPHGFDFLERDVRNMCALVHEAGVCRRRGPAPRRPHRGGDVSMVTARLSPAMPRPAVGRGGCRSAGLASPHG